MFSCSNPRQKWHTKTPRAHVRKSRRLLSFTSGPSCSTANIISLTQSLVSFLFTEYAWISTPFIWRTPFTPLCISPTVLVCMLLSTETDMYCKFPKYLDTQKICCIHSKIWTMWLYHRIMSLNDADGMANGVDPDQTAPLGAVWSGFALFAQAYLSEKLRIITVVLTKCSWWLVEDRCEPTKFWHTS